MQLQIAAATMTSLHHRLMRFETALEVKKYIRSQGFKCVGYGSSRAVFKISERRVIKIAHSKVAAGIAQNKREVGVTERLGHRHPLAEVKWYHPEYLWIISEKAEHIRHKRADKDFITDSAGSLRRAGVYDTEVWEHWGKIGERLVLMDYGASGRILDKYYRGR